MASRLDHGHGDGEEVHEINVTPFIDVMLVLLIIFMVAAPLATVDIAVNLPTSTAKPQPRTGKPVFLTLKADHSLVLGRVAVAMGELGRALDERTEGDRSQQVYLRADKTVDYDTLMKLMNKLQAAGYLKIALVGLEGIR